MHRLVQHENNWHCTSALQPQGPQPLRYWQCFFGQYYAHSSNKHNHTKFLVMFLTHLSPNSNKNTPSHANSPHLLWRSSRRPRRFNAVECFAPSHVALRNIAAGRVTAHCQSKPILIESIRSGDSGEHFAIVSVLCVRFCLSIVDGARS